MNRGGGVNALWTMSPGRMQISGLLASAPPGVAFARRIRYPVGMTTLDLWKKHPALVWSNAQADDSVRIRAGLLECRFPLILDIASVFGLARLREEWAALLQTADPEIQRAAPFVERILRNLERGWALALTGN